MQSFFLIILALTFLLGQLITGFFGIENTFERIGLSILLGSLFLTLGMMFAYLFFPIFSVSRIIIVIAIQILLFSALFYMKHKSISISKISLKNFFVTLSSLGTAEIWAILISATLWISTLWSNLIWPVAAWDSIALYDFRAKMISMTGSWEAGKELNYFFHIPPFTSLLHSIGYLFEFNSVKIWYSLLFLGFILTFYGILRRRVSRKRAILGSAFLVAAPFMYEHLLIAYTNLPFSIFFSLAIFYSWEWIHSGNNADSITAFVLGAGAIWIRQLEPFWVVLLILLFFGKAVHRRKPWGAFLSGLIIFWGIKSIWSNYTGTLDLFTNKNELQEEATFFLLEPFTVKSIFVHFFEVTKYILWYLIRPFTLLLFPLFTLIAFDKKFRQNKLFFIWILSLLLILGVV